MLALYFGNYRAACCRRHWHLGRPIIAEILFGLSIMGKRFYQIFTFGLLAGGLTGLAFASAYFGKLELRILWEHHLEFAAVAVTLGIISGALLSFEAYFCLWDKNLVIILPLLGLAAVLATIWLTLFGHRLGWNFLGFWGAIGFWILALPLAKYFAPEKDPGKCRR